MIDLTNLNIILTGATGVIGKSILYKLNSLKANVIACGTNQEKLDTIDKNFKNVVTKKIDLSNHLIIEQFIVELKSSSKETLEKILQMNRTLVHGAFTLDETGKKVIFRDTLQLENLDQNELEASIQALSLALAEYGSDFIEFAKN